MIVFNWSFSAWNHFTAVFLWASLRNRRFWIEQRTEQPKRLATYKKKQSEAIAEKSSNNINLVHARIEDEHCD